MPFKDVVGNAANTVPAQTAATGLNVGTINGSMVTDVVAVTIEQPALAGMVYVTI